jgi:phosphoribosylaminoimidazole-succinocarboxamide synthase
MMSQNVVLETNLPGVKKINQGKVRDIYEVDDKLLIVATDRISAYDSVMPNGIPYKGQVLTALTEFWLETLTPENHLITSDVDAMPEAIRAHADILRGRTMLVKKCEVIPIECVARGYLAGSGWKEYQASKTVCGISLPDGLVESDKLPETIFTPATKAESGHDENVSFEVAAGVVGLDVATEIRDRTIDLYTRGAEYARGKGIIICDTKFEWGVCDGKIILIDELLTPDSSRFWPEDGYAPGSTPASFDKQFVRDWLTGSGWDKEPPAPMLPEDVVQKTSEKYLQAYEILTGKPLV